MPNGNDILENWMSHSAQGFTMGTHTGYRVKVSPPGIEPGRTRRSTNFQSWPVYRFRHGDIGAGPSLPQLVGARSG
jgi:hypothetical protein